MGITNQLKEKFQLLVRFIFDEPEGGMIPPNDEEMPDITHFKLPQTKTKIIRDGIKSMDKKINEMEVDIIDIKVLHEDKVLVMYKEG